MMTVSSKASKLYAVIYIVVDSYLLCLNCLFALPYSWSCCSSCRIGCLSNLCSEKELIRLRLSVIVSINLEIRLSSGAFIIILSVQLYRYIASNGDLGKK